MGSGDVKSRAILFGYGSRTIGHGNVNLATIIDPHEASTIALIEDDREVSYDELRSLVAAMRQRLVDEGVGRGDHVVIACGNEVHFVVAALGVLGAGATAAPINPYSPINELRRKILPVAPKLIVVGDGARGLLDEVDAFRAPMLDMASVAASVPTAPPVLSAHPDDIAFLLSTSGVSGAPKVAMLSHGNLAWVHEAIVGDGPQQIRSDDVALGVLPFAHILGLNLVLLSTLRAGGTIVLQRRFDVDTSLDLVRKHAVTMLVGAPPMWQRWAAADAPSDSMSSVRFARSGAASLPADVYERIRDHCGVEVRQGYGLTESSSVVASGRGLDVRVTSVGKPLPGVELVLVDDAGEPVDIGDVGEVVLRSPGVFKGYLNDVEATESVLTDDGWLWTGDVGVLDDDGYLYLVDRVKDIIIVSGFNVYPAEVEDVLLLHPSVRGAVVVGSAHGETGETVVAHVSGVVDEAELDAFARTYLSRYKCPTEYHFLAELPPAPHGKRVRRELRS